MNTLEKAGGTVRIFPDLSELLHALAENFVHLAAAAIESRGRFTVALSGGSTPKDLYALLSGDAFRQRINWNEVHVYWSDERFVS